MNRFVIVRSRPPERFFTIWGAPGLPGDDVVFEGDHYEAHSVMARVNEVVSQLGENTIGKPLDALLRAYDRAVESGLISSERAAIIKRIGARPQEHEQEQA